MIKISTKFILSLSIIFFSIACRDLVRDDFPPYPSQPVLNSLLIADSTIYLHVSLSDGIDRDQLSGVTNAAVFLYVNDRFNQQLSHTHDGFYVAALKIAANNTYSFKVAIPGMDTAFASTYIPAPALISDIQHNSVEGTDDEGWYYSSITYTLEDDPELDNYYQFKILEGGGTDQFTKINDPVLLNEGLPLTLFSDELIEEGTYTMKVNYENSSSTTQIDGALSGFSPVVFEVRSLSQSYYAYLRSYYLYETGRYPDIVGGVPTALQLYSNVENGIGIVGGYSVTRPDTIKPDNQQLP